MATYNYVHGGEEYDLKSALDLILCGKWEQGVAEIQKLVGTDPQSARLIAKNIKDDWFDRSDERKQTLLEEGRSKLRDKGYAGYYEYKAVSVLDENGLSNIKRLEEVLNSMGMEGWRLRAATTNELGKNAIGLGIEGLGFGVNSTVDETILYFERYISLS